LIPLEEARREMVKRGAFVLEDEMREILFSIFDVVNPSVSSRLW
jgi:hypothetical protein